jgi:hypothetical protein
VAEPVGVEQELVEAGLDGEVAVGHLVVVYGCRALHPHSAAFLFAEICKTPGRNILRRESDKHTSLNCLSCNIKDTVDMIFVSF